MARNRKRAKDRRVRSAPEGAARAAVSEPTNDAPPDPIAHATPDVELAEAQLALGRPELVSEPEPGEDELDQLDEMRPLEPAPARGRSRGGRDGGAAGLPPRGGGEISVPGAAVPGPKLTLLARLLEFFRGSWHELQRVQWPDRRQVMQATGVVIGFVIVAGVFLGVADGLATDLMNFILK